MFLAEREMKTQVLAVANPKKGVGKTTTVVNLGAAFAELKKRTLVVDLDPQGELSASLGIAGLALQETISTALMAPGDGSDRTIYPVKAYLDLIPANIDLAATEIELSDDIRCESALRRVLEPLYARYDYIVIDCPPGLGVLTSNALAASQEVLIPVRCEPYALRSIRLLLETMDRVRNRLNPDLELAGVLPTLVCRRHRPNPRSTGREFRSALGRKVLDIMVPDSPAFPQASARRPDNP
jgi:chromosome partitioning protein